MSGVRAGDEPSGGIRPGEVALAFDPALAADASLAFIGRIRTPWRRGGSEPCPKNVHEAREQGASAVIEVDQHYRDGLRELTAGARLIVLYWMDAARRDLVVQAPRHRDRPIGVFSLRSPARPNPVALAVVTLLAIDLAACTLTVDAIDCYDGTPLLDIKPWLPSVDIPRGFSPEEQRRR